MNIQEIINRHLTEVFQVEELCLVVEHYIHRRKNRQVPINIYKVNHPLFIKHQVNMLHKAFDVASKWLRENEEDNK